MKCQDESCGGTLYATSDSVCFIATRVKQQSVFMTACGRCGRIHDDFGGLVFLQTIQSGRRKTFSPYLKKGKIVLRKRKKAE